MQKRLYAVALVLMTITAFASAQMSVTKVTVDVPFSFIVSGKTLPAGTYTLSASANLTQISVRGIDNKEAAIAMVTTRISQRSETEGSAVFDVAGNDHYLAEIYMPGIDGFTVPCAPGQHTHAVVKGKK
jgi:hypothetical protein